MPASSTWAGRVSPAATCAPLMAVSRLTTPPTPGCTRTPTRSPSPRRTRASSTTATTAGSTSPLDAGLTWTSLNNATFSATQFQSLATHPMRSPVPDRRHPGQRDELPAAERHLDPRRLRRRRVRAHRPERGGHDERDDVPHLLQPECGTGPHRVRPGRPRWRTPRTAAGRSWAAAAACPRTASAAPRIRCSTRRWRWGRAAPNTVYFGTDRLHRSTDMGTNNPVVSQVFAARRSVRSGSRRRTTTCASSGSPTARCSPRPRAPIR